jgi:2-keto-4-pentenoate hydratase/2-oxohepta-3-ene-1,7-dioic acid hydratase in catechol pathway
MARISRRRFLEKSAAAGAGAAVALKGLEAEAAEPDGGALLRLCRYQKGRTIGVALYNDDHLVDLQQLAGVLKITLPSSTDVLDYLPPETKAKPDLAQRYHKLPAEEKAKLRIATESIKLLVPIPEPKKVILLAGNYASHIVEGGGQAPERKETFPYFFWKPPSTTLTNPGDPIRVPKVSPDHVDWELELGVIIGKRCRDVSEKEALSYVAGYSVCNDVSDRHFTINAERKKRDKDSFFDWLHGKWHDTFLPMGPCVRSAADLADPQKLAMKLRVNGKVMQDANTGQMIFPVPAIVSILSTFTTLEPGDIISTGTPAGVGAGRKPPIYLMKGDVVDAWIDGIGTLQNPVV